MITSPSYFSKRALNGTPLDREPQAGADITPCQSFGQWQSTLEGNSSLSHPAISGVRLYECSFVSARNPSNPMRIFTL